MGLVSQEPILFDRTIYENIAYGTENATVAEVIEASKKANIHQFIAGLPRVSNGFSFLVFDDQSFKGIYCWTFRNVSRHIAMIKIKRHYNDSNNKKFYR